MAAQVVQAEVPAAAPELLNRHHGPSTSRRSGVAWAPDVALAVMATYVIVAILFFGAGYLLGRLVL